MENNIMKKLLRNNFEIILAFIFFISIVLVSVVTHCYIEDYREINGITIELGQELKPTTNYIK